MGIRMRRHYIVHHLLWAVLTLLVSCVYGNHDGSGNPLDWLREAIPGEPGVDYPINAEIKETAFSCENRVFGGYYADPEMGCQGYHVCLNSEEDNRKLSFLCPNGTIFHQEIFTCDWWFNVDCTAAVARYSVNDNIGVEDSLAAKDEDIPPPSPRPPPNKLVEHEPHEHEPHEHEPHEHKPEEPKPQVSKPEEPKPQVSKPEEPKPQVSKPEESKPQKPQAPKASQKKPETKPAPPKPEVKPAQPKPEIKPAQPKPTVATTVEPETEEPVRVTTVPIQTTSPPAKQQEKAQKPAAAQQPKPKVAPKAPSTPQKTQPPKEELKPQVKPEEPELTPDSPKEQTPSFEPETPVVKPQPTPQKPPPPARTTAPPRNPHHHLLKGQKPHRLQDHKQSPFQSPQQDQKPRATPPPKANRGNHFQSLKNHSCPNHASPLDPRAIHSSHLNKLST